MSEKFVTNKRLPHTVISPNLPTRMGTKIPNWLNKTWLRHRLLLVMGLSVGLHILAWGSITWGNIFKQPSKTQKTKTKNKISIDFINSNSNQKILTIAPPDKANHYATRPSIAANTKSPTDIKKISDNTVTQAKSHSIINAPPAPPKLAEKLASKHQQVAAKPQTPQPEQQPIKPKTPKTGLNTSLTPKSGKSSTKIHPSDIDPNLSTTKQVASLPTPELILPENNPIHSSNGPKHTNISSKENNALDRLKRIRKGTGGTTLFPSFSNPDGGIKTNNPFSLDVEGLLGNAEYDKRMLTAIYLRWIDLNNKHGTSNSYKVIILFEQSNKGAIKNLRVDSVNADRSVKATSIGMPGYICGSSIQGLSPYGNWPDTMRNRIGDHQRRCRFTFHYNIIQR